VQTVSETLKIGGKEELRGSKIENGTRKGATCDPAGRIFLYSKQFGINDL
jgi:hypothetical protein